MLACSYVNSQYYSYNKYIYKIWLNSIVIIIPNAMLAYGDYEEL